MKNACTKNLSCITDYQTWIFWHSHDRYDCVHFQLWTFGFTPLPPKPYHHFAAISLPWIIYYILLHTSIPTGAQYLTLQKCFSHPSLIIYFFATPPIRLKQRTANRWELLIANQLDQSLWLANQKQGSAVRSYLLHSSLAGAQLCCAFY